MSGLRRVDEGWLRHHGIAPYSEAELDEIAERVDRLRHQLADGQARLNEAARSAARSFEAFAEQVHALEIEIATEAATLLDPAAPTAEEGS